MENKPVKITNESNEKTLPLLKVLLERGVLIAMITILCALIGFGFGVLRTKPIYTASRAVIFRTEIKEGGNLSNDQYNQAALAKIYLPSVSSIVKSSAIITMSNTSIQATVNEVKRVSNAMVDASTKDIANKISSDRSTAQGKQVNFSTVRVEDVQKIIAGKQSIKLNAGAIEMDYEEKSLIFTLSYTDASPELASEKLEALIETVAQNLKDYVQADNVTLISTQNGNDISVSFNRVTFALIGAGVGFIGTVAVVLLAYALDNTLKTREELEEITGAGVLGVIDK